jgi:hypothetical protein
MEPLIRSVRDGETAHARLVHSHLKALNPGSPDFDTLYRSLAGDILEGGQGLDAHIRALGDKASALDVLEAGIAMEYRAYDLYRTLADTREEPELSRAFHSLSQAEKNHMDALTSALDKTAP